MLISELSQKTGASKDTIRFYEKVGLLGATIVRGENNYRHYDNEAVDRMAFIRQGKALGFTLSEIKKAIDEWNTLSPREKIQITRSKLEEVDEKIKQLQAEKSHLTKKLKRLKNTP
ncbi:MerR family transcriptional regulator [Almyronema epifaneia]|uniref:MerR family transcriptional regulator n=1 Tax=Almyronema epifaneia S1 TaxID=2991925 RepID=A0ABW6IH58_9CYAN